VFSQNGNTSLHVAAAEGHLDIIRYLLSSGLDANLQNKVCYIQYFCVIFSFISGFSEYLKSPEIHLLIFQALKVLN